MTTIDNTAATSPAAAGETDPSSSTAQQPAMWAIVELMGHQRIAGRISQMVFGGVALVRVDVPAVTVQEVAWETPGDPVTRTIAAHTRSLGAGSIYGIHWVDELAATVAAHEIRHEPVKPYRLQQALAALPVAEQTRLLALTAPTTGPTILGDDGGEHF